MERLKKMQGYASGSRGRVEMVYTRSRLRLSSICVDSNPGILYIFQCY